MKPSRPRSTESSAFSLWVNGERRKIGRKRVQFILESPHMIGFQALSHSDFCMPPFLALLSWFSPVFRILNCPCQASFWLCLIIFLSSQEIRWPVSASPHLVYAILMDLKPWYLGSSEQSCRVNHVSRPSIPLLTPWRLWSESFPMSWKILQLEY